MKEELKSLKPSTEFALQFATLQMQPSDNTVENISVLLETTEKGSVKNNLSNAVKVLSADPLLRGNIKYNLFTGRVDVVQDIGWKRNIASRTLTDNDLHNIHLYCEQTYGLSSLKNIEEALHIVANENVYHPVIDYLNSLKWDGSERIRFALHHFLGADTSDYTFEVMKLFMLGAISRVFKPGTKFDYIICVVGDQGSGKSTFFRMLAINDEWFTDDLKDLESGNVFEKLQGHWIIELSEMLAANNAKSNEAIKSFLSRQMETYRTPYERYPKDRLRQCVFAGTTNKLAFLPNDKTGNRRFLPVLCSGKNAEVFILDDEKASKEYINQMWAEAMTIWRSGSASLKLPADVYEAAQLNQKQFMQEDSDAGLILDYMMNILTNEGQRVCSRMLFKEALHNENTQPLRWQLNDINETVNQLISTGQLKDWERFNDPQRFGKEYGRQKGWKRIRDADVNVNSQLTIPDGFSRISEQDDIKF